jgi:D-inositol-3-phosphate glycosyltransferase
VPPGDPDALAAAISGLLANPEERRQLEERAATAASGPYSWDRIAEQTNAVYERVLA